MKKHGIIRGGKAFVLSSLVTSLFLLAPAQAGESVDAVAARWALGAGDDVVPQHDAAARRSSYADINDVPD